MVEVVQSPHVHANITINNTAFTIQSYLQTFGKMALSLRNTATMVDGIFGQRQFSIYVIRPSFERLGFSRGMENDRPLQPVLTKPFTLELIVKENLN